MIANNALVLGFPHLWGLLKVQRHRTDDDRVVLKSQTVGLMHAIVDMTGMRVESTFAGSAYTIAVAHKEEFLRALPALLALRRGGTTINVAAPKGLQ